MKIPKIVGVLNLSPESLNNAADSKEQSVIEQVRCMVADGADIIDVGAQSTRPGIEQISLEEEISRIKGVVASLKKAFPTILVSVDTTRDEIVRLALDEGADMVNDISGGRFDGRLLADVVKCRASYVLMHSQGGFSDMHRKYEYSDIVSDIKKYFLERIESCAKAGIPKDRIIIDPGIGFSKAGDQNMEIIRRLNELSDLGLPLYIGLSRKRFIGAIIGEQGSEERDNATTVLHTLCIEKGVDYIRTHNVKALKQCVQIMDAYNNSPTTKKFYLWKMI